MNLTIQYRISHRIWWVKRVVQLIFSLFSFLRRFPLLLGIHLESKTLLFIAFCWQPAPIIDVLAPLCWLLTPANNCWNSIPHSFIISEIFLSLETLWDSITLVEGEGYFFTQSFFQATVGGHLILRQCYNDDGKEKWDGCGKGDWDKIWLKDIIAPLID